ncbi:MAG TPA: protein kinase [Steroidobacteraceae bacterium]|nr:protein kinase [Steroidobacteraceae bacterium]
MGDINVQTTGPWREALGLIDILLSTPRDGREQLLSDLARARPELHARVRALLDADAEATRRGFMNVGSVAGRDESLQADMKLGPYRIVRELGKGGMGEVWLARRDDGLYEGEVAIKSLHPFLAHGVMRDRFLREAQLLGKLAHPNIARLLDAGASDGMVFIVLEYVRGDAIDVYCDARSLDVAARLGIFASVCAAVASAHANLIVHRDIKPSNILVTSAGEVKLLDFGIGKFLEPEGAGAERSELTRITGRVFTPAYAAPEQILGEPVTTATDVYSLGVLLYQLLAGVRPFGSETVGARVEHAVLHDEPEPLSRAAGRVDEKTAALRGVSPRRLQRVLGNDLEDIVHRALRKSPQERYGSVQALAEDLGRYARHEPVAARAGSRAYRVNRFVRRHRVGVAAAVGVSLATAIGVAGVLYQASETNQQARIAKLEAAKATSVKDYLLKIFEANSERHPDGAAARKTTAEELMGIATAEILADESQDPAVRLELMSVLHTINAQMENFPEQEALGKARIRVAEETFGAGDARLAEAWIDHSEFLRTRQRLDEARAAVLKAIELLEAQGDRGSLLRGRCEVQLAQIGLGTSNADPVEAVSHFQEAIRILEKLPPHHELVAAWLGLARTYEMTLRFEEAIAADERGIALAIAVDGPRSNAAGGGHQQLSRALLQTYRFEEAERHLAQAVEIFTFVQGPEGGYTMIAALDVGRTQVRRGRHRLAAEGLEKALANRVRVSGQDDLWTQQTRLALTSATLGIGDFARTRQLLDDCNIALREKHNARSIMATNRQAAALAIEESRYAEALSLIDRAIAENARGANARSAVTYPILTYRAEALAGLGRVDEARRALAEAEVLLEKFDKDPDRVDTQTARLARVSVDLADKRVDDARAGAAEALRRIQASKRRADLWNIEELAQRRLASAELAAGNRSAACTALDAAIALRSANALPADPRLAASRELRKNCT